MESLWAIAIVCFAQRDFLFGPHPLLLVQCLPQCGLFSPFVRTARFWVTEWGNQILTNMNIVGIDMLYKPQ